MAGSEELGLDLHHPSDFEALQAWPVAGARFAPWCENTLMLPKRPDVEYVIADFDDPLSIRQALEGVRRELSWWLNYG
jgi:uncharacterized protein YbjT (DUF2867 family)